MTFSYSAVIPAFNAAPTIKEAIESILVQTVPPQEIIVVDDGSTDDTGLAAAIGGPITILRQENRGPGAATTAGFKCVTTPFVATLDADDLWLPQKVARQAACFAEDPAVAGVFALARMFADGETPSPEGNGAVRSLWTRTTLMFRTEAAKEVGDFVDLPGRLGEVIDWIARSRDLGHQHVMIEEVLAMRRIRPGSLSHGRDTERSRGYLVAVHEAIERKKRKAAKKEAGSGSP